LVFCYQGLANAGIASMPSGPGVTGPDDAVTAVEAGEQEAREISTSHPLGDWPELTSGI
jgi:hypothetical protein